MRSSRSQTEMKLSWGVRLDNMRIDHANTKLKEKEKKKLQRTLKVVQL